MPNPATPAGENKLAFAAGDRSPFENHWTQLHLRHGIQGLAFLRCQRDRQSANNVVDVLRTIRTGDWRSFSPWFSSQASASWAGVAPR